MIPEFPSLVAKGSLLSIPEEEISIPVETILKAPRNSIDLDPSELPIDMDYLHAKLVLSESFNALLQCVEDDTDLVSLVTVPEIVVPVDDFLEVPTKPVDTSFEMSFEAFSSKRREDQRMLLQIPGSDTPYSCTSDSPYAPYPKTPRNSIGESEW